VPIGLILQQKKIIDKTKLEYDNQSAGEPMAYRSDLADAI
jgi:hypothetical protein